MRAYLDFCRSPAAVLQPASLARWRRHLAQDTDLSPNTINRRLAAVKRVVVEASVQGYVDHATADAFRQVRGVQVKALKARTKTIARIRLSPAQVRRLCDEPDLSTLKGFRDRALLHTLASSGCRVSGVVTLTERQILRRDGSFFLEVIDKNRTEPREAPLSQEAYAAIQSWLARRPLVSDFLFTSFGGKGNRPTPRPLHISSAWRVVTHYAARAGICEGATPHDLRRFLGTELARDDIRMAQKALGHRSIQTTAAHYVLDELRGGLSDELY